MNESEDLVETSINEDRYSVYRQMIKDIEFVQMLADPRYVFDLIKRGYFHNEKFRSYINGLKYLYRPEFFKLVKYPEGFYNLDAMVEKGFSEKMQNEENQKKFMLLCIKRNKEIEKGFIHWFELSSLPSTIKDYSPITIYNNYFKIFLRAMLGNLKKVEDQLYSNESIEIFLKVTSTPYPRLILYLMSLPSSTKLIRVKQKSECGDSSTSWVIVITMRHISWLPSPPIKVITFLLKTIKSSSPSTYLLKIPRNTSNYSRKNKKKS